MVNLLKNTVELKDGRIVTVKVGKVRHLDAAQKELGADDATKLARFLVPHLCTIDGKPLSKDEYLDMFMYDSMPIQTKVLELNGFLFENSSEAKENEVVLPDGRKAIIGYGKFEQLDKATRDAGKETHKIVRYLMPLLVAIDGKHLIMEDYENMPLDCYIPIQTKLTALNGFL
jgi:hypothetical protein